MKEGNIIKYQEKVLRLLSGRLEGFYLAGGTALSLYYFHHRGSLDLDFFTPTFNMVAVQNIVDELAAKMGKKIQLITQQNKKNLIKIAVYMIKLRPKESLKIDFVEDFLKTIKLPKLINGIAVLSLEDIYLRKVYAISGSIEVIDEIGRKVAAGGRQEAKDFFDLYCLSTILMPLSKFAYKYCDSVHKEALVRWFRSYDRMAIKTGLLELKTNKDIDYRLMESHFKKEIDKLIEKEVGI